MREARTIPAMLERRPVQRIFAQALARDSLIEISLVHEACLHSFFGFAQTNIPTNPERTVFKRTL